MRKICSLVIVFSAGCLAAEDGKQVYATFCGACHGLDGKGANNGQFPPLAGSEWVKGKPDRMVQVVLHGLQGKLAVAGKDYDLVMPPQGNTLTDEQLAATISYVRGAWGNKEGKVSVEEIQKQRKATESRQTMWEVDELLGKYPLPGGGGAGQSLTVKGGIRNLISKTYHGSFKSLEQLRKAEAENVEEEHGGLISVGQADRKDDFGLVWEGDLEVPKDGEYQFFLDADDGAALFINGKRIINYDRVGPIGKEQKARVKLKKGLAEIQVEYFEYKGEEEIRLSWSGPGMKRVWLSKKKGKSRGGAASIPIVPPVGEAVMYRNFIQGTTARGIGVGYFEGVNLAMSADTMSLDLIWRGKFMDGGRHWVNRGQGFQPPAGSDVVRVNDGPAFAWLEKENEKWPGGYEEKDKARFKGYVLDEKRRPTFHYEFRDMKVSDRCDPLTKGIGFKRKLGIMISKDLAESHWYFRAASGVVGVRDASGHSHYKLSNGWRLTLGQNVGMKDGEIRIPLRSGRNEIELTYEWK